jgi:hypothetical protein
MGSMSAKKHLIRRYLLATLLGFVVGIGGALAWYWYHMESIQGASPPRIDQEIVSNPYFAHSGHLNGFRVILQLLGFLAFLLYSGQGDLTVNILFVSTVLVPFAVYTFDVVAASRRKHGQGAV